MTDIHGFFGLSYSNYLILEPGQTTPALRAAIDELRRAYDQRCWPARIAQVAREIDAGDLTDALMLQYDITTNLDFLHDGCECGPEPEPADGEDARAFRSRWWQWDAGRGVHESDDQRWNFQGEEYERHQTLQLPIEPIDQASAAGRWVLPRTLLQSMPVEWQEQFVGLLQGTDQGADQDIDVLVGALADSTYLVRIFDRDGREISDPVPDYHRGRTHIEPNLEAIR